MKLNISAVSASSEGSVNLRQVVENKSNFSDIIESQVASSQLKEAISNDRENFFDQENTVEIEGKIFPSQNLKKESKQKYTEDDLSEISVINYTPPCQPLIQSSFKVSEFNSELSLQPDSNDLDQKKEVFEQKLESKIALVANSNLNIEDNSKILDTPVDLNKNNDENIDKAKAENIPEIERYHSMQEKMIELNKNKIETEIKFTVSEKIKSISQDNIGPQLDSESKKEGGKSKFNPEIQLTSIDRTEKINDFNPISNKMHTQDIKQNETQNMLRFNTASVETFEKKLGERLVTMIKENDHQVTLKINPPELEGIDINLELKGEKANLSFYTSNLQIKSVIENSINDLKNLLSQENLSLGEVNVFHQNSDGGRKNQQGFYESSEHERLGGIKNMNKTISSTQPKMLNSGEYSSGTVSYFV